MSLRKIFTYILEVQDASYVSYKCDNSIYKFSFKTDKFYGTELPYNIIREIIVGILHPECMSVIANYLLNIDVSEIDKSNNPGKTDWYPKEMFMPSDTSENYIITSSTSNR